MTIDIERIRAQEKATRDDLDFVAAAPADIDALLAEVAQLRGEVAEAQAQAERERKRREHDSVDAYNARIDAAVRQMKTYCK